MRSPSSRDKGFRSSALKTCLVLLTLVSAASIGEEKQAEKQAEKQTEKQGQKQAQPSRPRRAPPASRLKTIQLPEPATSSAVSFEQALAAQRKVEAPGNQRLDMAQVGQLAWATQAAMMPSVAAVTGPAQTAGDASIRAYVVVPDGVYLYEPAGHRLQPVGGDDVRATLAAALLNQPGAPAGGCQIILTASPRDFSARYGTRGRTVSALQAGKASEAVQLQAVALGLAFVSIDAVEGADVRRAARIPRNYEPLCAVLVGYPPGQAPDAAAQAAAAQSGRSALLVVPSRGFQDEELFTTARALELAGVQVVIASNRMGVLTGMLGGTAQANMLLNQANIDNYDAIVFIGGIGAIDYINNPPALNLARQAAVRQKVLAAIGTAPSILASAGALRGVRSTAYLSEQQRLILGGALYTGNPVEKDGLIVTATAPVAAQLFVQAIVEGLGEVRR